eukprot:CAMPEP_0119014552 /NCGR_PEP_ID=MMETSP1176-20130426/9941_1 /TAXON_ID=265551 /ORGANISM="Synedropsis recta cf, Strain CCMP1620" /LENGTH=286 /DNA_ID=CAMNT_0006967749 /DNA_START=14 /DNA_END=874 /DNA_ORIENTATION=+
MALQRIHSGLLALLLAAAVYLPYATAYPLITEVPENDSKCFRFNIPKDDDAHMAFMAMPSTMTPEIEEWYIDQMVSLGKDRNQPDGSLKRKFDAQPKEDMLKVLDAFMEENGRRSGLQLRIQKARNPRPMRQQELTWFLPTVLNHIERYQRKTDGGANKEWTPNAHLDGHTICLENKSETQVHVIFDIILVSEDYTDEDEEGKSGGIEKKHLTPLEQELAASVNAANSIISEMRYMEKREARMRITTESINARIRFFSYISVAVLLLVTYLQVTYLKRYFKKKKLM